MWSSGVVGAHYLFIDSEIIRADDATSSAQRHDETVVGSFAAVAAIPSHRSIDSEYRKIDMRQEHATGDTSWPTIRTNRPVMLSLLISKLLVELCIDDLLQQCTRKVGCGCFSGITKRLLRYMMS